MTSKPSDLSKMADSITVRVRELFELSSGAGEDEQKKRHAIKSSLEAGPGLMNDLRWMEDYVRELREATAAMLVTAQLVQNHFDIEDMEADNAEAE